MRRSKLSVGRIGDAAVLVAIVSLLVCAPRATFCDESSRKPEILIAPFDKDSALSVRESWAKHLKTDELVKNSAGIKLMLIPPGEYQMGSTREEAPTFTDEVLHTVRITQPFYLGMYEVTQDEFQAIVGHNLSWFSTSGKNKHRVPGLETSRFAAEGMSWYDTIEFCNKLSDKEGLKPFYDLKIFLRREDGSIENADVKLLGGNGYRLPTEAEWEYACRAGTTTPFYVGEELSKKNANIADPGVDGGKYAQRFGRPKVVGSYPPNAFGLFDMHGNVLEWCWDWIDDYDPKKQSDPAGPPSGASRVQRGGYWEWPPTFARSAKRISSSPEAGGDLSGFRLARTP